MEQKQEYSEIITADEVSKIGDVFSEVLDSSDFDLEGKTKDSPKTKYEKKRDIIGRSKLAFADVFLDAFNYFNNYLFMIKDMDIKIKINNSLYELKFISELRDNFERYGDGEFIEVSYYACEKIKEIVSEHREKMQKLVDLFYVLFVDKN